MMSYWKSHLSILFPAGLYLCLVCLPLSSAQLPAATRTTTATEADSGRTGEPTAAKQEEHALPQAPVVIARPFGFPITNSILVTWIVALSLIAFAQIATRNMQRVPQGLQNLWEWIVDGLYRLLENIVGPELIKKTFWFFATIFLFILACNWVGLIPGVGTVGWGYRDDSGTFHLTRPFFRGANADLNMTFAMAMVYFACWFIWAIQVNGVRGFFAHLFAPKGDTAGILKLVMFVVFFFVGIIEVVSILFRPVSLSFRLYGNVFAGESMLEAMARVVPSLAWLIPVPFYFLEIIVGLVQALVFMLLTAVFTLLICQHEQPHVKHA